MMLERLGAGAPTAPLTVAGQSQALLQRLQTALEESPTEPPPDPAEGPTLEERQALIKEMITSQWTNDFMLAMLMGDEEKLGPQPDKD